MTMHELDIFRLHNHHPHITRGIDWHKLGHYVRIWIFILCAAAVLFSLCGLLARVAAEILFNR